MSAMNNSDRFRSVNPIDNTILFEVDSWTEEQINLALQEGESVWQWWKVLPLPCRINHLKQIQKALRERKEEAALLITKEMGKPLSQSVAEVNKCIDLCDYYITYSEEFLNPDTVKSAPFKYNKIKYQPLGGILGVMPWNFPFWQVFRFAVPTLISGNIVWLKHAPNMNLCNQFLEDIFNVNLDKKIYRATFVDISSLEILVKHKHIQGTSLTGSERAGSSLASLSGKHIKKTLLELGGNDAFIICDGANLKEAIGKAVFSRMLNTGQTCISTKRLYIPYTKLEEVKTLVIEEINQYIGDDLLKDSTKIGVMAREDLANQILKQIQDLENSGFENWLQVGEDIGNFVAPRVFFAPEGKFYDEELFGPVLMVYGYHDIEEVIKAVNQSNFGLGAAVWSNDFKMAEYIADNIEVGSVAINNIVQSNVYLPFGGIKKSGFGRELGAESLLEFVNKKVIYS